MLNIDQMCKCSTPGDDVTSPVDCRTPGGTAPDSCVLSETNAADSSTHAISD